ncbi:MAG: 2-phospho-L-lactate transferase [Blastocatellia bacterium]
MRGRPDEPRPSDDRRNKPGGGSIVALAGGIGAAKFLTGLAGVVDPEQITVISNTGDDIELFGLRICPDIDTVMYTLGGVINPEHGWGLAGDTFESLGWMRRYAGPQWFNLGDRDLATHLYRTEQLNTGRSLTDVTDEMRGALGAKSPILPMTDSYAPTYVQTDEGEMHFQEYFVRRRCEPRVRALNLSHAAASTPSPAIGPAIAQARAVIVCPSNPFISIGPILAVPGIRSAIEETEAPVAAISPIVGGRAIKGPAADMLRDMGYQVSPVAVAHLYAGLVDLFVLDNQDAAAANEVQRSTGMRTLVTNTIMTSGEDKQRLAAETIQALGILTNR